MDPETLAAIAGRAVNDNMRSQARALRDFGPGFGLDRPHRLAHLIAQIGHESGGFRYDRELWGPTRAQARYDTRTDLGNTPERDGDGKRFRGRGPIQITGRGNYRRFTRWARAMNAAAPDFEADPDAVLTNPWEGLAAIWFWSTHNLNALADANDIEAITRAINGGVNGLTDRKLWFARAALVLLGFGRDDVAGFQAGHGLAIDGIAGPATSAALHRAMQAAWDDKSARAAATAAPPLGGLLARLLAFLSSLTRKDTA